MEAKIILFLKNIQFKIIFFYKLFEKIGIIFTNMVMQNLRRMNRSVKITSPVSNPRDKIARYPLLHLKNLELSIIYKIFKSERKKI